MADPVAKKDRPTVDLYSEDGAQGCCS